MWDGVVSILNATGLHALFNLMEYWNQIFHNCLRLQKRSEKLLNILYQLQKKTRLLYQCGQPSHLLWSMIATSFSTSNTILFLKQMASY